MYLVTYDGAIIHDPRTDTERVTDATCDLEANTAGSMTFAMAHDHPLYGRLAAMSAEHEVVLSQADSDGTIIRELFRGRITDAGEDGRLSRTITCEGCLAYLADSIVRPYGTYADTTSTTPAWTTIAPATARTYAEWLISQHNSQTDATKRFSIGRDELPDTPITRSSTEYPDTLSELQSKVLTDLSCYARAYMVDGTRYIDLLADGGGDAAQTIAFGTNLLDYATTRAMSEVITCIIPVASSTSTGTETPTLDGIPDGPVAGHDGCSKQGDHELWTPGVSKYGIRAEKVGYDVTTSQGLLDAACTDLTTASDVVESLSISAVDLSHVDPTVGPIGLLDWVRVISPPHGVDQYILCLKVSIDVDDPTQTKYTLGATLPTLTNSNAIRERETRQRITDEVQPVAAISQEAKATAQTAQATAKTAVATAKDAATITITSTHGLVFKSNAISTVLTVSVFQPGGNRIDNQAALIAAFGPTARIEWGWQREDEDGWSTILASDSRLSNDGFALSVSPADVDARTSFEASVVVD